jgi:hypothetical protein
MAVDIRGSGRILTTAHPTNTARAISLQPQMTLIDKSRGFSRPGESSFVCMRGHLPMEKQLSSLELFNLLILARDLYDEDDSEINYEVKSL